MDIGLADLVGANEMTDLVRNGTDLGQQYVEGIKED